MTDESGWKQTFAVVDSPLSELAITYAGQLGASPDYLARIRSLQAAGRATSPEAEAWAGESDTVSGDFGSDIVESTSAVQVEVSQKPSVLTSTLAIVAGLDPDIARESHPYVKQYATLGLFLLFRSLVIFLGVAAIWLVTGGDFGVSAFTGALTAAAVLVSSRLMTGTTGRHSYAVKLIGRAARLLFILFFSMLAAAALAAQFFSSEVSFSESQIQATTSGQVAADLDRSYAVRIKELDAQISETQAQLVQAQNAFDNEVAGTGTGAPGVGAKALNLLAKRDAIASILNDQKAEKQATIATRDLSIAEAVGRQNLSSDYSNRDRIRPIIYAYQNSSAVRFCFWLFAFVITIALIAPALARRSAGSFRHRQDALLKVSGLLGEAEREIKRLRVDGAAGSVSSSQARQGRREVNDSAMIGDEIDELDDRIRVISETRGLVIDLADARAKQRIRAS